MSPTGVRRAARRVTEGVFDLEDIQGNILKGYRHQECAYLFFSVTDPGAARSWLGDLTEVIQTAAHKPGALAVNLGISFSGLHALQVPATKLARLPEDFRQGMAARAAALGDDISELDGRATPTDWHAPFGPDGDLHLLLMISGDHDRVERYAASVRADCWQCGVTELDGAIRGHRLPGDIEHFGFRDGLSNPRITGLGAGDDGDGASVQPGEFVLGLPTEDGSALDDAPSLTRNGSYLVLRKLEQDADRFDAMVRLGAERTGLSDSVVRAKIMGRWPAGAPVTRYPDLEPQGWTPSGDDRDFDYAQDPGSGCPLGAHVRRANPRGALAFGGRLENRHRMLRRGMPYGSRPPAPADGADYGLVFACYQADIAGQFEFVQSQWLGDGNVFALSTDVDPVAAAPGEGGGRLRLEGTPGDDVRPATPPVFLDTMQRCVTSRGGEYFLVPGIAALRNIAALDELYRADAHSPHPLRHR